MFANNASYGFTVIVKGGISTLLGHGVGFATVIVGGFMVFVTLLACKAGLETFRKVNT